MVPCRSRPGPDPQQGQWVTPDGLPPRDRVGDRRCATRTARSATSSRAGSRHRARVRRERALGATGRAARPPRDLAAAAEQAALRRVASWSPASPRRPRSSSQSRGGAACCWRGVGAPALLRRGPRARTSSATPPSSTPASSCIGTVLPVEGESRTAPCPRPRPPDRWLRGRLGRGRARARQGGYRSWWRRVVVAGRVWGLRRRDLPRGPLPTAPSSPRGLPELVALALAGADAATSSPPRARGSSRLATRRAARARPGRRRAAAPRRRLAAARLARARIETHPATRPRSSTKRPSSSARPRAAARARAWDPPRAADRPRPEPALAALCNRARFPVGREAPDERCAEPIEVAVYSSSPRR